MAQHFTHILIVDDDADVCGVICAMLEETGYHTSNAKNAADARFILDRESVDLLVTDEWMVGEAGNSLANYAASLGIPALLISGHEASVEEFERGSRLFLRKPFHLEDLWRKVVEALGQPKGDADETGIASGVRCS
jgi:DNA-binding NtrC family response regulator